MVLIHKTVHFCSLTFFTCLSAVLLSGLVLLARDIISENMNTGAPDYIHQSAFDGFSKIKLDVKVDMSKLKALRQYMP